MHSTTKPAGHGALSQTVGRINPAVRIWALTIAMAASGLFIASLRDTWWIHQPLPLHLTGWFLGILFAASEIFVIHYQFRSEQYTFSLMELPFAMGLFFASWPTLIFARLIGGGLALRLHRKQAPMKLAFNLASFVLETSIAVTVFRWVGGHNPGQSGRVMFGAIVGTSLAVMTATAMIAVAISIYEGRPDRRTLVRLFGANLVVVLTNASLALVAVSVLWTTPGAGWLLIIVAMILFLGYRSYARLQRKHDDLELLYDFTRQTGKALQVDSAMKELLTQVRGVLRAGNAEIVIRSS